MAGGESSTAAGIREVIRTSLEQTNHTGMIYKRARTRWGHYRGKGMQRGTEPTAAPLTAIRSSLLRRSRAPIDELGAWEDGGAHHNAYGGERSVRGVSEEAGHRRRW